MERIVRKLSLLLGNCPVIYFALLTCYKKPFYVSIDCILFIALLPQWPHFHVDISSRFVRTRVN